MKKQTHTIAYIKRQAKNLKKESGISHNEALESISKTLGYSNWQHCQRTLGQQAVVKVEPVNTQLQLSFTDWLKRHSNRNSPLGDLSSDMMRDNTWPSYNNLEDYRNYLDFKGASWAAIEALGRAWKSYKTYLQIKKSPIANKLRTKTPTPKNHDQRKIVFVRNITPLHCAKRIAEKFNAGDKAWISWDGRKAIPVTILEGDGVHYTFRTERPIKKSGGHHILFLDEVRSTPELACMNRVTS